MQIYFLLRRFVALCAFFMIAWTALNVWLLWPFIQYRVWLQSSEAQQLEEQLKKLIDEFR